VITANWPKVFTQNNGP